MFNQQTFNELQQYLENTSDRSKIHIGCDSERIPGKQKNQWFARYTFVVVIHVDQCRGCKIFGDTMVERDFDSDCRKPAMRLMNEVYKVTDLYNQIYPLLADREIEIHLDINPDEKQTSSNIVSQAMGYVKGVTQITPTVKPDAFAASTAADRFKAKCLS